MSATLALPDDPVRYEIFPFGKIEQEIAELPEPVRLTVTCSPKHGPDRSVEIGARMRELGHAVTVHIAARMVRDRAHLDALLSDLASADIDDVLLVSGDADPVGDYTTAAELLPVISGHPRRPLTVGITGYPDGHPLIDPEALDRALLEKSRLADYVTTQLCFDPETLRRWVRATREGGMALPIWIGMPGQVTAARLLEMSMRIGVGSSVSFLRKQRGVRNLFGLSGGFGESAADRLDRELAPALSDPQLNVAGFHYYTFNKVLETWQWQQGVRSSTRARAFGRRAYRPPKERS